ncbi:MFS transporter [Actinocatenispora rupis]|uniref:MFS transporter n=1 Tax=Actinocatenispora rupis TaxID=519421 RepID=A0A8J3NGN3_9ACTN|nr:MFS transporter [Actinocatenispora rupis]GID16160.1 MFS transporter [Actinocatenispora rupis]
MTAAVSGGAAAPAAGRTSAWSLVLPLVLAQFIASYAGTNMNVAISTIADDIGTTVAGMQTTITLFTLTMAALMIPGSKLTDILGRKVCFLAGLTVYGVGAVIALLAQGLTAMVVGYSVLEGVGSALLIPPIYILITVKFRDTKSRAKYFGAVSGAAGLGAAAGPLIGGLLTSAVSWRAAFGLQVLVVAVVAVLALRITDERPASPRPRFDVVGAVLSAAGLFFVVLGILRSSTYGWFVSRKDFTVGGTVVIPKGGVSPIWLYIGVGAILLAAFVLYVRRRERRGREPLVPLRLFRNRTSNLGLVTQNVQWLTMQGSFFVISVFLQQVRHYDAIRTGLMLTPATIGILLASAAAGRLAQRRSQRFLIRIGFTVTTVGMILLPVFVRDDSGVLSFIPGLLLMGLGIGVMLTSSVNVVQSAFPEPDQGEISGLSRSVSNLGSSMGTAFAGSILVAAAVPGGRPFLLSLVALAVIAALGLVAALLLPRQPAPAGGGTSDQTTPRSARSSTAPT